MGLLPSGTPGVLGAPSVLQTGRRKSGFARGHQTRLRPVVESCSEEMVGPLVCEGLHCLGWLVYHELLLPEVGTGAYMPGRRVPIPHQIRMWPP